MTGKRFIILLAIVLLITAGFVLFARTKKPLNLLNSPSSQTWEIVLSFDSETTQLSLKEISLLSKTFRPDYRSAQDSAYQLLVVDKNQRPIYQTKINITEQLFEAPDIVYYKLATQSANPRVNLQKVFDTTIYIPYFENADKILIEKSGKNILEIKPKEKQKIVNLGIVKPVFAQTIQPVEGPLQVVFISEGYSSQQQFSADVQALKTTFTQTVPYSSNPGMFDFQEVYNTSSLGCMQSWNCLFNPEIRRIGLSRSPQASKFIVLVKGTAERGKDGVTNDVGGDTVILNTDLSSFTRVGVHEFLGHGVGQLYDRYVLIGKPGIKNNIRSNCSDNPSGEVFWRQAGVQRAYRGCDSWNLFAPFPLECNPPYLPPPLGGELPPYPPPPGVPPLLNDGNRSSIMSGGSCSGPQFDSVEQAWIRTQIIPRYQSAVVPTPTPVAPQAANDCSFNLTNNQIVRGSVLTRVSAVRANTSYFVSVILLNSRVGNFVGAVTPANSIVVNWNSTALFLNGPATLRCLITDTGLGGNTIFSKDVTVDVEN